MKTVVPSHTILRRKNDPAALEAELKRLVLDRASRDAGWVVGGHFMIPMNPKQRWVLVKNPMGIRVVITGVCTSSRKEKYQPLRAVRWDNVDVQDLIVLWYPEYPGQIPEDPLADLKMSGIG